MLPVMQPGALLFLGHGHARQGDGAAAGGGIETVTRRRVQRGGGEEAGVAAQQRGAPLDRGRASFPQGWPRVETDAELMTVASAASIAEALRQATLELHHWLDDDFGMSERTVNIFLGQAIEYQIANATAPHVTVVAKVKKAYMPAAAR